MPVAVIAVRTRLIKAVFFFRDESRELLTGKTSHRDLNKTFFSGCFYWREVPVSPAHTLALMSRSSPEDSVSIREHLSSDEETYAFCVCP